MVADFDRVGRSAKVLGTGRNWTDASVLTYELRGEGKKTNSDLIILVLVSSMLM